MNETALFILKNHGPWALLVAFFVWRQSKDYQGVCKRLNEVEDWLKKIFMVKIDENTAAINKNTEVVKRCHREEN